MPSGSGRATEVARMTLGEATGVIRDAVLARLHWPLVRGMHGTEVNGFLAGFPAAVPGGTLLAVVPCPDVAEYGGPGRVLVFVLVPRRAMSLSRLVALLGLDDRTEEDMAKTGVAVMVDPSGPPAAAQVACARGFIDWIMEAPR